MNFLDKSKAEEKIEQAQNILKSFRLEGSHSNILSALTLLAFAGIKPEDEWKQASRKSLRIAKEIMPFMNDVYKKSYAANSRESIRKNAISAFLEIGIIDLNPDDWTLPPQSSNTHYALTLPACNTLQKFGTPDWELAVENFNRYSASQVVIEKPAPVIRLINIENFKSVRNETLSLGKLNVFIGANGCGKTNILEAIAFLGASRFNDLSFDGLYSRGVRTSRPDLLLSSFRDSIDRSTIDINVSGETTQGACEVKGSFSPSSDRIFIQDGSIWLKKI